MPGQSDTLELKRAVRTLVDALPERLAAIEGWEVKQFGPDLTYLHPVTLADLRIYKTAKPLDAGLGDKWVFIRVDVRIPGLENQPFFLVGRNRRHIATAVEHLTESFRRGSNRIELWRIQGENRVAVNVGREFARGVFLNLNTTDQPGLSLM